MQIPIIDPIISTKIFIAIFIFFLIISIRRKKDSEIFPLSVTQELKGLAILTIVFSHVGYFLSVDKGFLFPLSIMAGVGVNLFLFLSGYGLSRSAMKKSLPILSFYKRNLLKLFTPFWIVICAFFILDYFVLHISYSWQYILQSLVGLFPRADLFLDVNSPFWFVTPIVFYYLVFPLVFVKRRPWLSAIIIYLLSYLVLQLGLPVSVDVLHLYELHLLAFPLGVAFASLFNQTEGTGDSKIDQLKVFFAKMKCRCVSEKNVKFIKTVIRYIFLVGLAFIIAYTAYHSGVDRGIDQEQATSILTMSAIILFFIIKKVEIKLLHLFGIYSFEIYLIHWAFMSRYDLFFSRLPGWIAMIIYLCVFLALAWGLHYLLRLFHRLKLAK